MARFSWRKWFGFESGLARREKRRARSRPQVELLENRLVPATAVTGFEIHAVASGGFFSGQHMSGLAVDPTTGNLYVATDNPTGEGISYSGFTLSRVTPADVVTQIGGYNIQHYELTDLTFGPDGNVYTVDTGTGRVYSINPNTGALALYSATGLSNLRRNQLFFDNGGNLIFYTETSNNGTFVFQRVIPGGGSQFLGGAPGADGDQAALEPNGNYVIFGDSSHPPYEVITAGHAAGTPFSTRAMSSGNATSLEGGLVGYSLGSIDPVTADIYSAIGNFGTGTARILFTPGNVGSTAPMTVFVDQIGNNQLNGTAIGVTNLRFGPRTDSLPGRSLFFLDTYTDTVYEVRGAAPTIGSFSPAVTEGGSAFALTVNGSNFDASASVQWNGTPLTVTSRTGSTQIQVTVPASLITEEGSASITATNPEMGATSAPATLAIVDAPLSNVSNVAFSATEGAPFSGTVASFTDPAGETNPADFSATITWGDGSTSPGTVVYAGMPGRFTVNASGTPHTYAEEGAQASSFFVTIHHGTLADVSTPTVPVPVQDAALHATATPVSATEGQPVNNVQVASFTDGDPGGQVGDYTATITWGDGESSTGNISAVSGGFVVTGSKPHAYVEEGSFTVGVTVTDTDGGASSSSWTSLASLPTALGEAATVAGSDGRVYVIGGANSSGVTNAVYVYAPATNSWTTVAPMPVARYYTAAARGSDGRIYTFGGGDPITGRPTNNVEVYDPATNTWTALASMPSGRLGASASLGSDSRIYILGGQDDSIGNLDASAVYVYTPGTNSWTTAASMPAGWAYGAATATAGTDGRIYYLAGHQERGQYVGSAAYAYSPATDTWTTLPYRPAAAGWLASAIGLDGTIYAIGGQDATGNTFSTVYAYSPSLNTWTQAPSMELGRASFGAAVGLDGRIYVAGGYSSVAGGLTSAAEAFSTGVARSQAVAAGSATVSDPAVIAAGGRSVSAVEGSLSASQVVATFTDPGGPEPVGGYSGTIAWGDNSSSAADRITYDTTTQTFSVWGSHRFAEEGQYSVAVTVHHEGAPDAAPVTSSAAVADAALHATATPVSATEGQPINNAVVATFTDADPNGTAADYSATIHWGDSQTSPGTIAANGSGGFNVSGSHTYAEQGSFAVAVTVTDQGGATTDVKQLSLIPTSTLTGLYDIYDVAVDAAGNRYVAESLPNRVALFAPGSTTPTSFFTGVSTPTWLAFDPAGNLYVASAFSSGLWKFAPGSTTPTATLSGLNNPQGLPTFDAHGNLFISNAGNNTVVEFAPGSTSPTAVLTGVTQPSYLDVDAHGDLFVSNSGVVSEFAPGSTTPTATLGGLTGAGDLAFDAAGDLFVGSSNTTVSEFAPGSTTPTATLTGVSGPNDLDFDASGNLFVLNSSANTVSEFAPGSTTPTATLTGLNQTIHMAVDARGDLYVVNYGSATVSEFTPMMVPGAVSTATVADAALTAGTATAGGGVEGATATSLSASFSDANPGAPAGDFTATINWGDGSPATTGAVAGSNGSYTVSGSHPYAEQGTYSATVSVSDVGGRTTTISGSATVADANLTAGPLTPPAVVEGQAFSNAVLFHFTDVNPNATAADYTATITWGDGTSATVSSTAGAAGQVVANSGGGFDVLGSHTYLEEFTNQTFQVAVSDQGGATVSASSNRFNVQDAMLGMTAFNPPAATEGQPITGAVLATFTDGDPNGAATDYTSTTSWGDGMVDTGTSGNGGITANAGGSFNVVGSHTYTEEATGLTFSVGVADVVVGTAFQSALINVSDAPLTPGTLTPPSAVEGQAFSNAVLFHFADADPNATAADYSATITWGDGNSDMVGSTAGAAGQVVANPAGGFDVLGGHTYLEELTNQTFQVSVSDHGTATTSASTSRFNVQDAPLMLTAFSPPSPTEGQAISNAVLARFTDGDPNGVPSDYSATITWGDGAVDTATVTNGGLVLNADGSYSVVGSHTYAEEAAGLSFSVQVSDGGGSVVFQGNKINVADAALTAGTVTAGGGVEGTTATSFSDANPGAPAGDFTATINWGDGSPATTGAVTGSNGSYTVSGAHQYIEEGT
jgi:N-acetylneuraminic acid mutarotase